MQVRVSNRQAGRRPGIARIRKDCLKILTSLGVDPRAELDVSVVGPKEMTSLNRTYRGIDRTTDVLSFPMQELGGRPPFRPPSGMPAFPLGDVVMDAELVREQALEAGHSAACEYRILLVHGILHLLGYDHEGMLLKEQKLLEVLDGISTSVK